MKKRIFVFVAVGVIALLTILSVLILSICDDLRFLVGEKISSLFRSADVLVVTPPECEKYTLDELKEKEHTVFNNSMLLVNNTYVLEESFLPEILSYNGAEMTEETLSAYQNLSSYLKEEYASPLYVRSSYRTSQEQKDIYDSSEKNVAAEVGASEHQTGLALDVYVNGYAGNALLKCEAGRYLHSDCWRYGFIIRYPNGKTDITGIVFEPWHIRFVGLPHAKIMYLESLTLEEYITEYLIVGDFYFIDNAYISRQALDTEGKLSVPVGAESLVISPDNTGHYIITAYFSE